MPIRPRAVPSGEGRLGGEEKSRDPVTRVPAEVQLSSPVGYGVAKVTITEGLKSQELTEKPTVLVYFLLLTRIVAVTW